MLQLNFTQRLGDLDLQVNRELPSQGICAIFGLSGAGKTSVINAIAGMTKLKQGSIILNSRTLADTACGIHLPPEKRRVGYVFQDARLFPHYRVEGNLKYGMASSMASQFDNIVELLGIKPLLKRFPLTLSGGEKQRVAIGRALLTAPELLLMDEPLASLDLPRKRELLPYLERLAQDVNIPILYVSHSMDEVVRLAQHVMVMDNGKVRAFGQIDDVWASTAMRAWLKGDDQSSVLSAELIEQHPRYQMSALSLGQQRLWVDRIDAPLGSLQRVRIHAADVSLTLQIPQESSIRNVVKATIVECLPIERHIEVKLDIDGLILWARITPWAKDELQLKAGQSVFAQIKSVSLSQHVV